MCSSDLGQALIAGDSAVNGAASGLRPLCASKKSKTGIGYKSHQSAPEGQEAPLTQMDGMNEAAWKVHAGSYRWEGWFFSGGLMLDRARSKNSTRTTTYVNFENLSSPYFAEKVRSFCGNAATMRVCSGGDSNFYRVGSQEVQTTSFGQKQSAVTNPKSSHTLSIQV